MTVRYIRELSRGWGAYHFPHHLFAFCLVYAFRLLDGDSISTLYASYLLPELLLFACGMTLLYLTGIATTLSVCATARSLPSKSSVPAFSPCRDFG